MSKPVRVTELTIDGSGNIKNSMSRDEFEKLESIKWIKTPLNIIENPAKETLPYPNDYECIYGIQPYVQISFKINIGYETLSNLIDGLVEMGFMVYGQGVYDKYTEYKLLDYISRIIVTIDDDSMCWVFDPCIRNHDLVNNTIKKFLAKSTINKESNFVMIAQGSEGLYSEDASFKAKPLKDNRFDLYYGEKFPHDKLLKFFDDKSDRLLLLWGDPGTGKSNYIKHLISKTEQQVIYIPPSMLGAIATPSFVSYMMSNKQSILLLEDCEEILGCDRTAATANLLGLTSGFLEDALDLKVIATFNADIGIVDPALLRKGRLYMSYEFKKLSVIEANALAKHCDIDHTFTEESTLADIFNTAGHSSELLKPKSGPIGFGNF